MSSTSTVFLPSDARSFRVDGISHTYGGRRILSDISFTISSEARVGLIGENGAGKSTLLRLLAGVEVADSGIISRPERTGLLWQEPPFDARASFDDVLDDALVEMRGLERELEQAAASLADGGDAAALRYDAALDAATRADVWAARAQAESTLAALGLAGIPGTRCVGELSGGQRARLSLAWLLIRRPTALLLDEPTNHLDDAATSYVLAMIRDWPGPVLFASHDRAFLDEAATSIIDLDPAPHEGDGASGDRFVGAPGGESAGPIEEDPDVPGGAAHEETSAVSGRGLTAFGGTFSDYLVERERRRERWRSRYRTEQDELERLAELAERAHDFGRINAARAEVRMARKFFADRNARVISERVRSAESRAEALARVAIGPPPQPLRFSPPRREERVQDAPIVAMDSAGLDGRLQPVSLELGADGALLVTGANGAGKSTLLHVLAGRLAPSIGTIAFAGGLRVGFLAQDVSFTNDERRASDLYRDAVGAALAETAPIEAFGLFTPADARRPAATLSVGQRRRLAIAIVLADPPDLLLLDEPTNHLSLALATELEDALAAYHGAVVIASHDRWLRRRWAGDRLELHPAG